MEIDDSAVAAGKRLREAREAVEVDQSDLARAAGVHAKTVSKWENGRQRPHRNQLERIAPLLRRSVPWLEHGVADAGVEVSGGPTGFDLYRWGQEDQQILASLEKAMWILKQRLEPGESDPVARPARRKPGPPSKEPARGRRSAT